MPPDHLVPKLRASLAGAAFAIAQDVRRRADEYGPAEGSRYGQDRIDAWAAAMALLYHQSAAGIAKRRLTKSVAMLLERRRAAA